MNFMEMSQYLGSVLKKRMPCTLWDGRASILEMKEGGSGNWRQMEWIGFYFQFVCEKFLSDVMEIPGPRYGNTEFDGLLNIPWDFKAHAMNTSSHQVIVNDSNAISTAIQNFGAMGLILALGEVEYNDDNREFQKWHTREKGGRSKYERERIARGAWSRKRKVSFALRQIVFIPIIEELLNECGSFQGEFRNADGSPRSSKTLLDLEKLNEEEIYSVEFGE